MGDPQITYFSQKPLGIVFSNTMPIKIREVTAESHAERSGVKLGWLLKRIGDVVVTQENFERTLGEGLASLPHFGRSASLNSPGRSSLARIPTMGHKHRSIAC